MKPIAYIEMEHTKRRIEKQLRLILKNDKPTYQKIDVGSCYKKSSIRGMIIDRIRYISRDYFYRNNIDNIDDIMGRFQIHTELGEWYVAYKNDELLADYAMKKYISEHFTNHHFFFDFLEMGKNFEIAKSCVDSVRNKTCLTCCHYHVDYTKAWCDLYKSTSPPDAVNCEHYEKSIWLLNELGYKEKPHEQKEQKTEDRSRNSDR